MGIWGAWDQRSLRSLGAGSQGRQSPYRGTITHEAQPYAPALPQSDVGPCGRIGGGWIKGAASADTRASCDQRTFVRSYRPATSAGQSPHSTLQDTVATEAEFHLPTLNTPDLLHTSCARAAPSRRRPPLPPDPPPRSGVTRPPGGVAARNAGWKREPWRSWFLLVPCFLWSLAPWSVREGGGLVRCVRLCVCRAVRRT